MWNYAHNGECTGSCSLLDFIHTPFRLAYLHNARDPYCLIAQCHDGFTAEVCYIQFDGDKFYVGDTRLLNRISSNLLSYHSFDTLTDMLLGPDSGLVT